MKHILRLISIILLLNSLNASAQERKMLSVEDAMWNAQVGVRAFPAQQSGTLSVEEALMPIPGINRHMLSVEDALWNAQVGAMAMNYPAEQMNSAMPYSQPFSAYQQPVRYVAAYAPPVYYAAPAPQQNQAFVNWLFGTPRREYAPADVADPAPEAAQVAAVIAPTATVAAEPTLTHPAAIQASVSAAPAVRTRPVEERAPAAAIPETTVWDILNYWTRKIALTGLLLIMIGFALYKDHAAKHQASRRIADLEQEMHRLDRLIYGEDRSASDRNATDRKGGHTP